MMMPQQGLGGMAPDQLTAMLSDPQTPPGLRAAAMAAMQMHQPSAPQQPPAQTPQAAPGPQQPAQLPPFNAAPPDVMAPLRAGTALADSMRMAMGGAVRAYARGGAVRMAEGGDPADYLNSMDDGTDPTVSRGTSGGLQSMDPRFISMVKAMMKDSDAAPSSEDKGLALAQAGFAMAASKSPHIGQAIGEGGVSGLEALQKIRQQRAVQAMKGLALQNTMMNAQSLAGYRGIRGADVQQHMDLTKKGIHSAEEWAPVIETAIKMGDPSMIYKFAGTGPGRAANIGTALRLIGPEHPDFAQNLLAMTAEKSNAVQLGKNAAGPEVLNPGAGQIRNVPAALPTRAPVGAPVGSGGPVVPSATAPINVPPAASVQPQAAALPPGAPAPAPVAVPRPTSVPSPYDVLGTPAPIPQGITGAMQNEMKGRADDYVKQFKAIDDQADAAKNVGFIYDNMNAAKGHIMMGKGSDAWNQANQYLLQGANLVNKTFGDNTIDTKSMNDQASNYTDFSKNSVVLVGAAAHAVSPRMALQGMNYVKTGVPNNEMPETGYNLVMAQLGAIQDFGLAKQKAREVYLSNPKNNTKTLNEFDAKFNDAVDPAVFMLHRMQDPDGNPSEEASAAIENIRKMPNGKAILNKLIKQTQNAKALGLFPEQ